MPRLITLSRAARLVGVKRGALQKKIQQGELRTFEGELLLADLLRVEPPPLPRPPSQQTAPESFVACSQASAAPAADSITRLLPAPCCDDAGYADWGLALRRAAELLAPGGSIIVAELTRHDQHWTSDVCGDLWLGFEPSELQRWAEKAGLENCESPETARTPVPQSSRSADG